MRLFAFVFAVLALFSGVMAVDIQKSIIVTYPKTTPDSVIEQAKKAIIDGGGIITHEYHIIKGFAAKVGEKVVETISVLGQEYNAIVEEDDIVSAL